MKDRAAKKTVLCHLVAGAVFSVLLFMNMLALDYSGHLERQISALETVRVKAVVMTRAAKRMAGAVREIEVYLPRGYEKVTNRELMLISLDGLKARVEGVEVTVNEFSEKGGVITLPVHIEVPVKSYGRVLEVIGGLQYMRFPRFDIEEVRLEQDDTSGTVSKISGTLSMPSEKVRELNVEGTGDGLGT